MTTYDIHINPYTILTEWLQIQPNLVSLITTSDKLICEFNHNAAQEVIFKKEIAKRLFSINNSTIIESIISKVEELQTDQLLYSSQQAVTLTNIGTTYKDLYTDFGGRPFFVDTTGFTSLAIQILWTKIGAGVQQMRVINNADDDQILQSSSLTTQSNEFSNVAIPQTYLNFKGKWRLQVKSTVAGDDPVFAAIYIYLRR